MTLKSRLAKLEAERPRHDAVPGENLLEGKSIEELTALYNQWKRDLMSSSELEGKSIDELMVIYKRACQ